MKALLLIISMLSCVTFANEVQNGGGGICIQDRCMTLAEAGLRIVREKKPNFQPFAELIKETDKILQMMPLSDIHKQAFMAKIVGKFETFVKVETADPGKFADTKRAYIDIIRNANTSINPKDFVLFAASEAKSLTQVKDRNDFKTYLLPEFFKANIRSQSLTLIHEALVRGQDPAILPYVVEFDGLLLNFINRNGAYRMDDMELMNSMRDLGLFGIERGNAHRDLISVGDRLTHILFVIEKILNRPLKMEEVFGVGSKPISSSAYYGGSVVMSADRKSLLLSQAFFPILPEIFDNLAVNFSTILSASSSANSADELFVNSFCKGKTLGQWLFFSNLNGSAGVVQCGAQNSANYYYTFTAVSAPRL